MLRQQIISSNKIHNFFGKIRDSSANLHPFLRWQKSTHKETSSFSKLLVLLFSTVLLALLYHFLCLLLRTVNVCVCKPCHAFFAHFPRNLTIKKSLKFRCHFEWISPWKCRESVRWWRSLWVSLSARSRFGPAQATLNLGLRRFSRIRPDYSQVSNS